jgi:hypothetical protein
MKLFVYFTESHKRMFEYLFRSVERLHEFELHSFCGEQVCEGSYDSSNYGQCTFDRTEFFLNSNQWNTNEIVLSCDADVLLLKPVKQFLLESIEDFDIVFQTDNISMLNIVECCMGFFVCRTNERVRELFVETSKLKNFHDDQKALNSIINKTNVKYSRFDSRIWNSSLSTTMPDDILVYHANFMMGVENKEKALKIVYQKFFE